MAKLEKLPEQAIIDGFKGTVDFYVYKGVPCARSWPKSPGSNRAPAVQATWPLFTQATKLWAFLSPTVKQAYDNMARGTRLTGRETFIQSYMSGKQHFSLEDGYVSP